MKNLNLFSFLLLSSFILFTGCDDDATGSIDPCNSGFDQEALFINMADNLIIPGYMDLQNEVESMKIATDAFIANPDISNLSNLQDAFKATYLSWQHVAQYEFGPAEEVFLRNNLNNFPLDITAFNSTLESEEYKLNDPNNYDKGFPALDYMLFGLQNTNDQIIPFYDNEENAEKLRNYLQAIVYDIKSKVDFTLQKWNDSYRAEFVSNTGTAAGTSLSIIINALNHNYELIKREKLGVPSGVLTINIPFPEKVEAFYSGESLNLAKAALSASEILYTGNTGTGLDDFLIEVNATKENQQLNDLIKTQFANAKTALNTMDGNLTEIIENDPTPVITAYNEVTKQLVNIKTDMPSVLCVSITYIDNPSDSD